MPQDSDHSRALRALAKKTGTPAINLSTLTLPLNVLELVREEIALRYCVLPLRADDKRLFVATTDPNDKALLEKVSFASGKQVVAYAALESMLADTITKAYTARRAGDAFWHGPEARAAQRGAPPESAAAREHSIVKHLQQPTTAVAVPEAPAPFAGDSSYKTPISPRIQKAGRHTVLVVDDEKVICKIVHQALTQRGFDVLQANTGTDALRMIEEKLPDAILLDAMLPDIHGFDVCKRLNESEQYRKIPVVMMTAVYKGWRMAADLKEMYGVAAYIEKPFDLHDLASQLDDAIAGREHVGQADKTTFSQEAKRLYHDASAKYEKGDLEGAITEMAAAVKIDPLHASLRQQLGLLYVARGQEFAAIQELSAAVELDPMSYTGLRNLAILFQRRGFRRKACEFWEQALAHAPDDDARLEIRELLLNIL